MYALPLLGGMKSWIAQRRRLWCLLLLAIGILLAMYVRVAWRGFVSEDYSTFTGSWYATIQSQGFAAFRTGFSNYTPLYLYLLFIVSKVLPWLFGLYAVKLPSVAADFLCAWLVQQIAARKYGSQSVIPWIGFLTVLFIPTVILNGSAWGQADSIYTAALLASLLFLLQSRPTLGLLAFGVALALKFQAIFFLPFLAALWLRGTFSWKHWFWIPFVYFLSILPAWLAGRPLADLITIYISQTDLYKNLTLNAPNLYTWFPQNAYDLLYPSGMALCAGLCLLFVIAVRRSKIALTAPVLVQLAMVSVLLVPFFLPKMHERYFFPADLLSLVYALYFPAFFFIPMLVCGISWISYMPFLFKIDEPPIPLPIAGLILFVALCIVTIRLFVTLYPAILRRPAPRS
jgi:Gpi18-like mannosyltransferase